MSQQSIVIRGARQHNLKNLDLEIPRNKFVVITGLSGSGKSSLAFDTIYAEGQRRYVESLSSYARQFLERCDKPDVESISGLSPAIAIEQKGTPYNPRSTVGTMTEIHDYLRLLFARTGKPFCWKCGRPIKAQSREEILQQLLAYPGGTHLTILAPLVEGKKGSFREVFFRLKTQGFVRVRADAQIYSLEEEIRLKKNIKHTIEVVIDRTAADEKNRERMADSLETALKLGEGKVKLLIEGPKHEERIFSQHYACPYCGVSLGEISPRIFSFNSPYGACPECSGLGTRLVVSPELVIPDPGRSINEGAVLPWSSPITTRRQRWKSAARGYYEKLLDGACEHYRIPKDRSFRRLTKKHQKIILYGSQEPVFED
ncbi:MAG TPA: excinuclease ABC subunit UvrA, partial [bacterium]|nr:excinuclease ABC subunit UvrA [bacterium]